MADKLTKSQLAKLKGRGAILVSKLESKVKPVVAAKIDTAQSSPEMLVAIRTAEAAARAAEAAADMALKLTQNNHNLTTSIIEVMNNNTVISFKINRDKNKLMTTVDLVRKNANS